MSRATELADKHKGRADDCGELARAVLADRERQAGEAVADQAEVRLIAQNIREFAQELSLEFETGDLERAADLLEILASQAVRADSRPNSVEASAMMDSVLAEYGWPANPKNAARAGFEACRRMLAAAPSPDGKAEQAEAPSASYIQTVIEALYENSDPVSVDAAELLQRLATQPTASNAGERGEFEAWSLTYHEHVDEWTGARYRSDVWEDMWLAFQAGRAALASKPPAGEQKPVGVVRLGTEPWNAGCSVVDLNAPLTVGTLVYASTPPEQVAQDSERVRLLTEVEATGEGLRYSLDCLVNNGVNTFRVCDEEENEYLGDDWVLDPVQAIDEAIRAARARGEGERS